MKGNPKKEHNTNFDWKKTQKKSTTVNMNDLKRCSRDLTLCWTLCISFATEDERTATQGRGDSFHKFRFSVRAQLEIAFATFGMNFE